MKDIIKKVIVKDFEKVSNMHTERNILDKANQGSNEQQFAKEDFILTCNISILQSGSNQCMRVTDQIVY